MNGLKEKRALVTGASTGIGRAVALRLAREQVDVAVNYLNSEERARETWTECRDHGVNSTIVQADVSREDDVEGMFETVFDALGGLDLLVNNAGIQLKSPSHELDPDEFDRVLAVNLRGPYLCARQAIQHFLDRDDPGVIVNISSVHETIPRPYFLGYSASKGGLQNLTRTLALEYADEGIRVNSVAPGTVATPINDWTDQPEERERVEEHVPLGWVAKPDEIAGSVAFLASSDAGYITGSTLFVDGGLTLYPDFREPWSQ